MNTYIASPTKNVNWRQVGAFVGLTFALSWAGNLILALTTGYGANTSTLLLLQLQMLIPAFSAILLALFFFKNNPIYFRNYSERPRWFLYFFLFYTLVYAGLAAGNLLEPDQGMVFSAVSSSLTILGLMVLIGVRGFSSGEAFARAGLKGGTFRQWVLYGLVFVAFYGLQTGLNAVFGLGQPVNPAEAAEALTGGQTGVPSMSPQVFLLIAAVQTILVGSLIGTLIAFGEEYGWRGYLQGELIKMGKKRGVLVLGLIWSTWHFPVIWMGHNYPGYPLAGTFLMTGYTTLLAFVFGYVMMKTGSIWLVAFLHALNNQTLSFFASLIYRPDHPIFSFGAGLFGLLTAAPLVWLLLRDPIWQDEVQDEAPAQNATPVGEGAR